MRSLHIQSFAYSFLLAFITLSANAALIQISETGIGVNKITRDTHSGLDWLDIDLTADLTWNEAEAIYSAFGFSHASVSQVEGLFMDAGITDIDSGTSSANFNPSAALQNLITCRSGFDSTTNSSTCLSSGNTSLDSLGRSELSWIDRNNTLHVSTVIANSNNFIGSSGSAALDTFHHPLRSHWMVRNVTVPEPYTILPMLFGLLLILYSSHRPNENNDHRNTKT